MIDQPQGDKPALTVVIQSWWTPALSVIMLVVGLLAGYFGRPLVNKGEATPITALTTPAADNPTSQAAAPTSTTDPTLVADSQKQLMDYLVSNTIHFQGDSNATVTIIEFSDYQ
jgi:protein-disulfide isomerase